MCAARVALAIGAMLVAPGAARAGGPSAPASASAPAASAADRDRARALFESGARASEERRYADALADYRGSLAADPGSPTAAVTRLRVADLEAHSEGGFAPLLRLDEVRRDPDKCRDRASLEALERDASAFPAGPVRSEARILVAEAYWHELHDPRRALVVFDAVLEDPAAETPMRSLALSERVAVAKEIDQLRGALDAAKRHPELAPRLAPALARAVRREDERTLARVAALALGGLGAASFVRAARKARDPRRAARGLARPRVVGATLAMGPIAALAARLDDRLDPLPLLLLGPALLVAYVAARAAFLAVRVERAPARALRWATWALGFAALAFLLLDWTGPRALDVLGL